jgi:hypothetical protein
MRLRWQSSRNSLPSTPPISSTSEPVSQEKRLICSYANTVKLPSMILQATGITHARKKKNDLNVTVVD